MQILAYIFIPHHQHGYNLEAVKTLSFGRSYPPFPEVFLISSLCVCVCAAETEPRVCTHHTLYPALQKALCFQQQ